MLRPAILAASIIVALAGCASTQTTPRRVSLTSEEISSLKPELTIHSNCVVSKFRDYAADTDDVQLIVDTVIAFCRDALRPLTERLDKFNLIESSREAYLRAVERSSANVLTDALLRARSRTLNRTDFPGRRVPFDR